jgi:hypothetical protein
MVANDGWAADPCQGRQPPEGGGRRPAFTGVRRPVTIEARGLMNGARHVHVERDSYVTARQRMQTWLRIEPLVPVIYLRPMSPAGRYLSAMRSWPDILWSGLCSGSPAPQPAGSAPPIPSDRSRAPDACRSEPRARGRCVTDQGPTPSRQPETPRAAAMEAQPPVTIAARRVIACCRCGNSVSDRVRLSPIRRPRAPRSLTAPANGRADNGSNWLPRDRCAPFMRGFSPPLTVLDSSSGLSVSLA